MLENTRFHPGETTNDPAFARELADGCDLFVNDAFGSAHRAHASTVGVAQLLPAYAGLLLLGRAGAPRPAARRRRAAVPARHRRRQGRRQARRAQNLGGRADEVLVGGKMAEELRDENPLSFPVVLPTDVVAASDVRGGRGDAGGAVRRAARTAGSGSTSGPRRARTSRGGSARAKTVFWNGPMGVFEWEPFAGGHEGGRRGRRRGRRLHGRRRRRLGPRRQRARPRRPRLLGLDRRRRLARAARGQGASRRRGDPGELSVMLIAGNWKMFKGPGEARGVLRRLRRRPRASTSCSARRSSRSPPRSRAAAPSTPRTSTGSRRAPTRARSRPRCCSSSASTARSSATRSGGSCSARATRRSPAARAPRSTPGSA